MMKEVIRIHKPNSAFFIEKRLVMNVYDELIYEKFQVLYDIRHSDKVTLYYAYNSDLKKYQNYHVNAIINLFNRTFISNYNISLWLLDNGNIYFNVNGNNVPSCYGYINKKEQKISWNSCNEGLGFYRHYMFDMFRELSNGNYKFVTNYRSNWFSYESE